jgi:hypothetical protein
MQYAVRFALKRDGEMVAPPRMTYSSHNAPRRLEPVGLLGAARSHSSLESAAIRAREGSHYDQRGIAAAENSGERARRSISSIKCSPSSGPSSAKLLDA